jgi:hypothetical protein
VSVYLASNGAVATIPSAYAASAITTASIPHHQPPIQHSIRAGHTSTSMERFPFLFSLNNTFTCPDAVPLKQGEPLYGGNKTEDLSFLYFDFESLGNGPPCIMLFIP